MDAAMRAEMQARRGSDELRAIAVRNGMRTLQDDALRLVRAGVTTLDEVMRVAPV